MFPLRVYIQATQSSYHRDLQKDQTVYNTKDQRDFKLCLQEPWQRIAFKQRSG